MLSDDWLNDGCKGFVSGKGDQKIFLRLPNLMIMTPSADYMLAMKAMSARLDSQDRSDLEFLIKYKGLTTVEDVLNIVKNYYPRNRIKPATQFFIEEVIDDLNS